jgi:hypothetical protein
MLLSLNSAKFYFCFSKSELNKTNFRLARQNSTDFLSFSIKINKVSIGYTYFLFVTQKAELCNHKNTNFQIFIRKYQDSRLHENILNSLIRSHS